MNNTKGRPFWVYLLIFIVCQLLAMAVVVIARLSGYEMSLRTSLVLPLAVANILSIVLFFVVQRRVTYVDRDDRLAISLPHLLAAPALIVFVNLVQENCLSFLPDWVGQTNIEVILDSVVGLVVVCLLGPVAEELLFRCGVQGALQQRARVGAWWPVCASAAIFSLIHMNPMQMPAAFVLGLLLGGAYWRTGQLWTSIIIHVLNNSLAVVVALLGPSDATLTDCVGGPKAAFIVGVVTLLWVILCFRKTFSLYNKV